MNEPTSRQHGHDGHRSRRGLWIGMLVGVLGFSAYLFLTGDEVESKPEESSHEQGSHADHAAPATPSDDAHGKKALLSDADVEEAGAEHRAEGSIADPNADVTALMPPSPENMEPPDPAALGSQQDRERTPEEIDAITKRSAAMITTVVDRLEADAEVARKAGDTDRAQLLQTRATRLRDRIEKLKREAAEIR